jgi:autotransporter-associated beta strand protein
LGAGTGELRLAGGNLNTLGGVTVTNPFRVTEDSSITTTNTTSTVLIFDSNVVTGTGKLTIRNDAPSGSGTFNVYFGGNGDTFAPGPIEIVNGAFGSSSLSTSTPFGTQNFNHPISGNGSYQRSGLSHYIGVTSFNAANAYSGGTSITAGTLLVNNVSGSGTGSGPVSVGPSGKLGGTGTIAGEVANAGRIAPGNSVGTLTLENDLTMGADSILAIEVNGSTADRLVIGGDLDLSAVQFLDVTGSGAGSWVVATYAGTLTGMFDFVTPGFIVDYSTIGQISLSQVAIDGDFNNDGVVDAADYVVWRNSPVRHDAEHSTWRANYGHPLGAGSVADADYTTPVPEPAVLVLLIAGLAACASGRQSRTR